MANYLYNGVELPDINTVWTDKETLPHATIFPHDGTYRLLVASSLQWRKSSDGVSEYLRVVDSNILYELVDDLWALLTDNTDDTGGYAWKDVTQLTWTNKDIYYVDASDVYLAASESVPVTTAPAPDPLSMMLGMLVGRIINGQRT